MKSFITILVMLFLFNSSVQAVEYNSEPTKIIIPSTTIMLDVKPAEISYDTWTVRLDAASFGYSSAIPGNMGNTVIFSHALPALFGNLPTIKKGDTVNVFTDLDWFVYKVTQINIVDPENVSILNQIYPYQLTLYTCVGENYSQRFVITAELLSNHAS